MTPQRTRKNNPKVSWQGHQLHDSSGKITGHSSFKMHPLINPFRGMEEYVEHYLPSELRALCQKPQIK